METEKRKINHEWIAVFGVFFLNVLFRFCLGNFPKIITVYPDELRYVGIAKSIANGGGLAIGGLETDFQKIMYSIALLPAELLKSGTKQNLAILLLNCIYMSATIFPIYCLAKRLELSRKSMIGIAILFLAFSDQLYSLTFMSEVVFLPLMLTAIALTTKLFNENVFRKRIGLGIVIGIIYYLLYLTKEIALSVIMSYVIVNFSEVIITREKQKRKEEILVCLSVTMTFLLLFVTLKLILFNGMGNSYNQMGISAILSKYNLFYLFYGAFYYFVCILLAMGIFPILIPLAGLTDYKKEDRKLLVYILMILAISIGVVAYTITVREDLGKIAPRQHMRYVYPLLIPLVMVTMKWFQRKENVSSKNVCRIACLTVLATVLIVLGFKGIGVGPCVDQTPLKLIERYMNRQQYLHSGTVTELEIGIAEIAVKVIVVLLCAAVVFAIRFFPYKSVYAVAALIIGLNLANTAAGYGEFRERYEIDTESVEEMESLNQFLSTLNGNVVCVVQNNSRVWGLVDTYLNSRDIAVVYSDTLETMMSGQAYIDLNHNKLIGKFPYVPYENWDIADYVIIAEGAGSLKTETVENVTPEEITSFKVYKNIETDKLYYRSYLPIDAGEQVRISDSDGILYSMYPVVDGTYISGETPNYLIYGPYFPLKNGEYSVEMFYTCESGKDIVGVADICFENVTSNISADMRAEQSSVKLDFVLIEDCNSIEFRMMTTQPGVKFEYLTITKVQ